MTECKHTWLKGVGLTLGMDYSTKARGPLGKQTSNSVRKDICLICLLVY